MLPDVHFCRTKLLERVNVFQLHLTVRKNSSYRKSSIVNKGHSTLQTYMMLKGQHSGHKWARRGE